MLCLCSREIRDFSRPPVPAVRVYQWGDMQQVRSDVFRCVQMCQPVPFSGSPTRWWSSCPAEPTAGTGRRGRSVPGRSCSLRGRRAGLSRCVGRTQCCSKAESRNHCSRLPPEEPPCWLHNTPHNTHAGSRRAASSTATSFPGLCAWWEM